MKILVIGSGGREHSLAWRCAQSDNIDTVFVAPGNAGTARENKLENVSIDIMDFEGLANFAEAESIALTIVGPEAPLVEGIVDYFSDRQLACFGPNKAAAQLEGSKAFTKEFLRRHDIPTAQFAVFSDLNAATSYIKQRGAPIVIKADGLAAGKGVLVAESEEAALAAVTEMLAENRFGDAGHRVVIEDFLAGEEASFIALVDGRHVLPMATSQDHKLRDEGDKGPNTGGMGAYSPATVVTEAIHQRIMEQIIYPTVRGMAADGNEYLGFLYAGLMISRTGDPYVIEFNCRFGDPEAQPVMMRLQSNLPKLCLAALERKLDQQSAEWDPRSAVGVVMAAGGYPAEYASGKVISGLDKTTADNQKVFHAGTGEKNGEVVTDGGRVLCATALGDTVAAAAESAYQLADGISWENVYYRRDIAHRAIGRENS